MLEYIKVSEYAKIKGLHYRTIVKHYKLGLIDGYTNEFGRIYLKNPLFIKEEQKQIENKNNVILYARVSSSTNKKSLDGQIERLKMFAIAKGYTIVGEYKEIASGLNDNRKMLNTIFDRGDFSILLVEHKDRLTRFGYGYINKLFEKTNKTIEIVNTIENEQKEIMDDFIAIVTSFCGKIYGRKRKNKTKEIIEKIKEDCKDEE